MNNMALGQKTLASFPQKREGKGPVWSRAFFLGENRMAWIESHEELRHHEKVARLCRVLNINKPQALGHLHLLWWWVAKYREGGALTEVSIGEICEAAEWKGEKNLFVTALKNCDFLDSKNGVLSIHDWKKYGIKYLILGRKRKQKHDKKKRSSNVTGT